MDPALEEQIDGTLNQDEMIEAIIRLTKRDQYPPGIMVVSSFDNIITCRVRRGDIQKVYDHPAVASFKAPRVFYHDWNEKVQTKENTRHPLLNENDFNPGLALTGKKVVIGLIDWGADFAHADFINEDGTTRFIALWDQNHPQNQMSPQPFGYGKMYNRDAINKALKTTTPYAALGYHPGIGDPKGKGMHGTHVMGIACANGRSGQKGIAPEAEIIFVHLGSSNTDGRFNLGDSGRLLEAIDFIRQTAGEKPLAINISAGKHGGPHDGCTLVEMCIDHFLEEHLNTAICQSTGNYFNANTHCSGLIRPGGMEEISFITGHTRVTENELEIWYSGKDEFGIGLQYENNSDIHICNLESSTEIKINGLTAGWMYHRSLDPNNKRNMVDIFLYPGAPVGKWRLTIYGERITDGRFHAWIERADQGQSKFSDANIIRTATTNTICNSNNSIVTGAYDQTDADYPIAPFSSSGPTLDGRLKPHILAPGIKITSSKSSPPNQQAGSNQVVQMSGTSMASPFITGVVALILQGIKKKATIFDIRNILFKSCTAIERTSDEDKLRGGYGIIDLQKIQKNIDWFNSHDLREAPAKNKNTDAESFEEDETEPQECGVEFFEHKENEPEIYAC
jgi:subtilisin family serine protease